MFSGLGYQVRIGWCGLSSEMTTCPWSLSGDTSRISTMWNARRTRCGRTPATLKLFWDYLDWAKLAWTDVGLGQLARFMAWLRRHEPDVLSFGEATIRRRETTINTILAAVNSFYEFHERLGSLPVFERYRFGVRPSNANKPFLHHITKGQPVRTCLVKARSQHRLPRTLATEEIEALLGACTQVRDQLLLCLLRDTGMRIGGSP